MTRTLRIRQAQTITPFGVGAVLEVQGESFVAAGIEHWPTGLTEVTSGRLAARLKVIGFRAAPHTLNDRYDRADHPGVPYVRFPAWLFCASCRTMTRFRREKEKRGEPPSCSACAAAPRLSPVRFVRICDAGHLDDVDWWYWAHSRSSADKRAACPDSSRRQDAARLRFHVADRATGLGALSVRCDALTDRGTACGAERDLLDILGPQGSRCSGRNPWQRRSAAADCTEQVHVVQRTAGNLYYPVVHSALDIPGSDVATPEEERDREESADAVRRHYLWDALLQSRGTPQEAQLREMIADATGADEDLIGRLAAVAVGDAPAPDAAAAPDPGDTDLSRAEWRAFVTTELPEVTPHFAIRRGGLGIEAEHSGEGAVGPGAVLAGHIGRVVLADRLREVRALVGFQRRAPGGPHTVPADTGGRLRWLPAVEVYGEGILLTLDRRRLAAWEEHPDVLRHVAGIRADLAESFRAEQLTETTGADLSPRFLLLHTLAHLLIRQLSFESGYTTASLRERVYGRPENDQHGLLVYAGAGDAEGTLGGLVRQGEAPHFAETMVRVLEAAAWCSADPLCAEHTGQGFGNLNRAACHACTLLPETSCQTGNTLLDRALVVGSAAVPGYFADVLAAGREFAAATALENRHDRP